MRSDCDSKFTIALVPSANATLATLKETFGRDAVPLLARWISRLVESDLNEVTLFVVFLCAKLNGLVLVYRNLLLFQENIIAALHGFFWERRDVVLRPDLQSSFMIRDVLLRLVLRVTFG